MRKVIESLDNTLNEGSILKNSGFTKYYDLEVTGKTAKHEIGFMSDKDNPKDVSVFIYSKTNDSCIATFNKSESAKILKGFQEAFSKF